MSKFTQITSYFWYLIILLAFSGCKKEDPFIASEIIPKELLGYYIVTEYKYVGSSTESRGEKSFMTVTYFKENNAKMRMVAAYVVSRPETPLFVDYDAISGVTSLISENNLVVKLTRNRKGEIILAAPLKVPFENAETVHSELIKDSALSYYSDFAAKGVENNTGYFKFLNIRWKYSPTNSFPTLDWSYSVAIGYLWFGQDGGDTRWFNLFVVIPKGIGWKGKRKDKDLLLLFYVDGSKSVDGIVICERIE